MTARRKPRVGVRERRCAACRFEAMPYDRDKLEAQLRQDAIWARIMAATLVFDDEALTARFREGDPTVAIDLHDRLEAHAENLRRDVLKCEVVAARLLVAATRAVNGLDRDGNPIRPEKVA